MGRKLTLEMTKLENFGKFSKVNSVTPKNSNVGGTRYEQKLL